MKGQRPILALVICASAVAISFLVSWAYGSTGASWGDLWQTLWGDTDLATREIFLRVRLPRVLLAAVVGAGLSVAGVAFQALLRNPLAEPFLVGVSGGGVLGATIALGLGLETIGLGLSARPLFAFAGALGSVALILWFARVQGRLQNTTILLTGVVLNAIYSAAILFLTSFLPPERFQAIMAWMRGTLVPRDSGETLPLAAGLVLVGTAVLYRQARSLDVVTFGEDSARGLGVDTRRLRLVVLIVASVITGAVVAISGLIGFVGLLVPHVLRSLFGPRHRLLLPTALLGGAAFMMLADTLVRVLSRPLTSEFPVSVVTALVGGPFFLFLLRRERRRLYWG
ncbi:MAG: iron ABC transporter permease [Planctomycetota bacterium]